MQETKEVTIIVNKNVLNDKNLEQVIGGMIPGLEDISEPARIDKTLCREAGFNRHDQDTVNAIANKHGIICGADGSTAICAAEKQESGGKNR